MEKLPIDASSLKISLTISSIPVSNDLEDAETALETANENVKTAQEATDNAKSEVKKKVTQNNTIDISNVDALNTIMEWVAFRGKNDILGAETDIDQTIIDSAELAAIIENIGMDIIWKNTIDQSLPDVTWVDNNLKDAFKTQILESNIIEKEPMNLSREEKRVADTVVKKWDYTGNSQSELKTYLSDNGIPYNSSVDTEKIHNKAKNARDSKDSLKYISKVSEKTAQVSNLNQYVSSIEVPVSEDDSVLDAKIASKDATRKSAINDIDVIISKLKNDYNILSVMEDNLENMWYISECEPWKDTKTVDWYKFAKYSDLNDYTIPCSKRKFNEFANAKKREIINSLMNAYDSYSTRYNELWQQVIYDSLYKANADIDSNGQTTCLSWTEVLGFWCSDVESIQMWWYAYLAGIWSIAIDPFDCNLQSANGIKACKDGQAGTVGAGSDGSFRMVRTPGWGVWFKWLMYLAGIWAILFDLSSTPVTTITWSRADTYTSN